MIAHPAQAGGQNPAYRPSGALSKKYATLAAAVKEASDMGHRVRKLIAALVFLAVPVLPLSAAADAMLPPALPPLDPAALPAARHLVETLKLVPLVKSDCGYRFLIAREVAARIAGYKADLEIKDRITLLYLIQRHVIDFMTNDRIKSMSDKIEDQTAENFAGEFRDPAQIKQIDQFFQTDAGAQIEKFYLISNSLMADAPGFVIFTELGAHAEAIKQMSLAEYQLIQKGAPLPESGC